MGELIEGELIPAGRRGPPSHNPATRAAVAERRTEALRLKGLGYSYDQIADLLGYKSRANAAQDVTRALRDRAKARDAAADTLIELETGRLEALLTEVYKVMSARHYHISGGKVATRVTKYATDDAGNILLDEDGNPKAEQIEELVDDGPILAAVDRAVRISESLRRLQGLDKPQKIDVQGTVQHAYGVEIEEV